MTIKLDLEYKEEKVIRLEEETFELEPVEDEKTKNDSLCSQYREDEVQE